MTNFGFKTIYVAKNGSEAINLFRKHKNNIDIVLTDIIMPNKNGFEVSKVLEKEKPGLPIIFMTGYDKTKISIETNNEIKLINKPFSADDLKEKIIDVLESIK